MSSDNNSLSDAFDELYDEVLESCVADNPISNLLSSILNDIQEDEATSSNTKRKKRSYYERGREDGHARLWSDYFSDNPLYSDEQFRRKFRMRKSLFIRIKNSLESRYPYFQQSRDATGRQSITPLQKCSDAMRLLAYGVSADAVDDYFRIGESTSLECLKKFTKGVIEIFGDEYLRRPTEVDLQRLLHVGAQRGFPGMLGSIDCMHWQWKNCPTAWHGMFTSGHKGKPTIILEAVASYDLWIWHAYFGVAGANNDINVLDRSPVFDEFLEGRGPQVQFSVNGSSYNMGYYLADGIYPEWATFVKTFPRAESLSDKRKYFAQQQESARKDVERAFALLQSKFAIVASPCRLHKRSEIGNIIKACIILHNMIIDDERDTYGVTRDYHYDVPNNDNNAPGQVSRGRLPTYYANREEYFENHRRIRNRSKHHQLQNDLMEHLWNSRTSGGRGDGVGGSVN